MDSSSTLRAALCGILALVAPLALVGATDSTAGAQAPRLAGCPAGLAGTKDFIALWTDSAAERSGAIARARLGALDGFVEEAASCSAALTVVFDPAQSRTSVVYHGDPFVAEGTPIAFERKSYAVVADQVEPLVARRLHRALAVRPSSVSSPTGAYQVLADDRTGGRLEALVLSSFVEQDAAADLDRPLGTPEARTLAARLAVPRLHNATVEIEGVGVTADATPAPDDWLGAVRTFALTTCRRTGARCQVRTQVPVP